MVVYGRRLIAEVGPALVAGNKAGDWSRWYKTAIPIAEAAFDTWLAEERKRRDDS
jgi:hypothetical protein